MITWCEELTHWKRPWCWERLKVGGEEDDGGCDGWMAPPTQWTWIWVNSRGWWRTGKPGVLLSMRSQRVGHNWMIELNWMMSPSTMSRRSNGHLWIVIFNTVMVSEVQNEGRKEKRKLKRKMRGRDEGRKEGEKGGKADREACQQAGKKRKERRKYKLYETDTMWLAKPKIQVVLASHSIALTETLQSKMPLLTIQPFTENVMTPCHWRYPNGQQTYREV